MTLTTATRTIEISWGSLYLNFPRFGLHVQRDATAPVLGFERVASRAIAGLLDRHPEWEVAVVADSAYLREV